MEFLETPLESYTPGALQNFSPDLKKTFVSILSVNYISDRINLSEFNFRPIWKWTYFPGLGG